MTPTIAGLLLGAVLGIATAVEGFSGFAITLVFALAGLVVARVLSGELDVSSYVSSAERRLKDRS